MSDSPPPPSVVVVAEGCAPALLLPGDLIGRADTAAFTINDPGISEVHCYVSLRGGALWLLALRGRMGVNGQLISEVRLEVGLTVRLSRTCTMEVTDVVEPRQVLVFSSPDLGQRLLSRSCSLRCDPLPTLEPGARSEALLQLWPSGDRWFWRDATGTTGEISDQIEWTLNNRVYTASWVDLEDLSAPATVHNDRLDAPLRLVAQYDSVHIYKGDRLRVAVSGRGAQLISELVAFGGPVRWEVLAGEIWGSDIPRDRLRAMLDVTLQRLRKRLSAASVRPTLVSATNTGQIELLLHPNDKVEADL